MLYFTRYKLTHPVVGGPVVGGDCRSSPLQNVANPLNRRIRHGLHTILHDSSGWTIAVWKLAERGQEVLERGSLHHVEGLLVEDDKTRDGVEYLSIKFCLSPETRRYLGGMWGGKRIGS